MYKTIQLKFCKFCRQFKMSDKERDNYQNSNNRRQRKLNSDFVNNNNNNHGVFGLNYAVQPGNTGALKK